LSANFDGHMVAVSYGKCLRVMCGKTFETMADFSIDHVIKTCAVSFADNGVAVLTDYGCASMYTF